MSLHSSFKMDRAGLTARSVQTRIERIKELMKKGLWKEESDVIGLPKTRIVRLKAKKKVKAEEDAVALDAAAGAGPAKGGTEAAKAVAKTTAASAKGGSASGGKPAAGPKK